MPLKKQKYSISNIWRLEEIHIDKNEIYWKTKVFNM